MHSTIPIRCSMLLSAAVLLSACGSVPLNKPEGALTKAQYAIAQASQQVGQHGQSVPLYEANKRLDQAQRLVANPNATEADYTKARRLAEEATVAAHLAQARAEAQQAQARQAALEETLKTLRQEIHPKEAE